MASDIKLLRIEQAGAHDKLITYPSWQEAGTYLRRLDGVYITHIGLYKTETVNEDEYFLVGGGGEHYVCTYAVNGKKYHLLYDEIEVNAVTSHPIKDIEEHPRKYCVSFEDLYQNVKFFYEYGQMHPNYKWEEE